MTRVSTSRQSNLRLAIGVAIAAALVAFFVMGGSRLLDWHVLAQHRSAWQDWLGSHPFLGGIGFFVIY
ncbi:MAG: hypothetical protein AB7V13_16715, partial [Pseudorhodoplanes sp.]